MKCYAKTNILLHEVIKTNMHAPFHEVTKPLRLRIKIESLLHYFRGDYSQFMSAFVMLLSRDTEWLVSLLRNVRGIIFIYVSQELNTINSRSSIDLMLFLQNI